jgi:hypothetical protein
VVIGSRTYSERTSGGWRDVDDPGIIYMIVFNRQGREILSIEGVRSDTAETAFYVLVAAKLASIFRVPLTFYDPPPEPYKSVDVLWTGIANADQRSVDRWFDKYAWTLKRRGLFRPEGVYALIGITTVLAFAVGIRWLSLTQALSTFGVMSGCVAMIAIGAVLCICGWQPGLRPSPMSRAGGAVFIHRSEVRIIIGSMLLFAAGTLFFLAPVIAMLREPPAAAFAREDRERTERDRPRFSYRVEVRPDGTRDVKFEHHNMKNTDVGLELMSKPEPEVREKGVYVLENAERDHPRRAEVVRALIPFLQHENKRTREVAVRGLGRWGYRDTIPELEPMLNDPDNQVRRAAAEAIRDINSRGGR